MLEEANVKFFDLVVSLGEGTKSPEAKFWSGVLMLVSDVEVEGRKSSSGN